MPRRKRRKIIDDFRLRERRRKQLLVCPYCGGRILFSHHRKKVDDDRWQINWEAHCVKCHRDWEYENLPPFYNEFDVYARIIDEAAGGGR